MSYSRAFSQAIVALVYISDKIQQGMFEFISTQQISDDLNIPPSTTGMILRRLNRAGILETREGAKGGVQLALQPDEVSILDVFNAIEQERPLFHANLKMRVKGEKPSRAQESIADVFGAAETAMKAELAAVTLADILKKLY